ncbi:MAG: hypothetical protein MRJ68_20290 [Nitrospira sp.]|nr:hypothetical protein [Nitrospira sp.]
MDTDDKYHGLIKERVILAFHRQGLKLDLEGPYKPGQPLLRLTVRPEPIEIGRPGKILYYRNIELSENVISERTPHIRAWAVTASFGFGDPIVSDNVTLERLERDADELVNGFIQDFLFANGKQEMEAEGGGKRR